METRFVFTQARIRSLPSPVKGRKIYYDTEVPKLACRVSSNGNKTYIIIKRFSGKVKTITIGKTSDVSIKSAQDKAKIELANMAQGIDPTAEKRKNDAESTTLLECLEQYITTRSLKQNTINDYRYKVNHDLSEWANRPVINITEKMVMKKQKQLTQIGKTVANASMRVLRAVMNYAHAIGMINTNPVDILSRTRVWHKNKRRDRIIPSEQLKEWYEAVERLQNKKAKAYFLILLYMGFRSSEALTLEWANVNMKKQTITALDTKNHSDHTLVIPIALLPEIKVLYKQTGHSKWVFAGKNPENPMTVPKKQILAISKTTGILFSSHDIRRTFATIGEAVGVPLTMIKRLMNHVTTDDITSSYIVTEDETLRVAINKVADYIQSRVTQQDNVITLHTKAE